MLRSKVYVKPKSDNARQKFVKYLNSKNIVRLEHKRKDRWFFSALDDPENWFWVDYPDDDNWEYKELTGDANE